MGFNKDKAIANGQKLLMLRHNPYEVNEASYLPIVSTKDIEIGARPPGLTAFAEIWLRLPGARAGVGILMFFHTTTGCSSPACFLIFYHNGCEWLWCSYGTLFVLVSIFSIYAVISVHNGDALGDADNLITNESLGEIDNKDVICLQVAASNVQSSC